MKSVMDDIKKIRERGSLATSGYARGVTITLPMSKMTAILDTIDEFKDALDYLLSQTVDADLEHGIGLTEGETMAREQALAALAKSVREEVKG